MGSHTSNLKVMSL
jgi:WD40 repeat protein